MPVYFDPKRTFDYVLIADRDKENPTTFEIQTLTARQHMQLMDMLEKEGSGLNTAIKILKVGVVGWRNFGGIAFNIDEIDNYLTPGEIAEITSTVIAQRDIDEVLKKKSELPLESNTA